MLWRIVGKAIGFALYDYQARNQKFFRAGEIFWNEGTSINVSCVTHKRKALQRKILVFFPQDSLKITF